MMSPMMILVLVWYLDLFLVEELWAFWAFACVAEECLGHRRGRWRVGQMISSFSYILIGLRKKTPADLEGQIYDAQVSIVNK